MLLSQAKTIHNIKAEYDARVQRLEKEKSDFMQRFNQLQRQLGAGQSSKPATSTMEKGTTDASARTANVKPMEAGTHRRLHEVEADGSVPDMDEIQQRTQKKRNYVSLRMETKKFLVEEAAILGDEATYAKYKGIYEFTRNNLSSWRMQNLTVSFPNFPFNEVFH